MLNVLARMLLKTGIWTRLKWQGGRPWRLSSSSSSLQKKVWTDSKQIAHVRKEKRWDRYEINGLRQRLVESFALKYIHQEQSSRTGDEANLDCKEPLATQLCILIEQGLGICWAQHSSLYVSTLDEAIRIPPFPRPACYLQRIGILIPIQYESSSNPTPREISIKIQFLVY